MHDNYLHFLLTEDLFWWSLIAVSAVGYVFYYLREVVKVNIRAESALLILHGTATIKYEKNSLP